LSETGITEEYDMSNGKVGGNLRNFYILFAIVAAIGIGALGYNVVSKARGTAAMEPVDLSGAGEDMRRLTEMAVPVTKGEESAPVTIVVFGDFYCNHCGAFSLRERPRVESEYVETGKARLVFYDFVLDPRPQAGTFLAARAARCAGDQGRYWEYHDRLYRTQLTWGAESDKVGAFQDMGEDLGLDGDEFKGCLNSDRHAQEVSANIELAHALGLDGTPAILVGTEGGMSRRLPTYLFEVIQEAVEAILEGTGLN
jgi:protein-disulfide isomerase